MSIFSMLHQIVMTPVIATSLNLIPQTKLLIFQLYQGYKARGYNRENVHVCVTHGVITKNLRAKRLAFKYLLLPASQMSEVVKQSMFTVVRSC